MKTTSGNRWISTAVLIAVAVLVSACGGGGSVSGPSSSSGSATATIQGQVVRSQSATTGESPVTVALRATLGLGVAEAAVAGSPVSGATVKLLQGTTVIATTTTDANGQFSFRNLAAGTYTVQVLVDGLVAKTLQVTVGADDQAIIGVATNGESTVEVTAISTDVYNNDAQLGHAVNIANASSRCDLVGVTHLREQGLGWGEIAQRCGASPSVIGLGRSNLSDEDLDDARERTGHGRKHGARGGGNGKGKGRS